MIMVTRSMTTARLGDLGVFSEVLGGAWHGWRGDSCLVVIVGDVWGAWRGFEWCEQFGG